MSPRSAVEEIVNLMDNTHEGVVVCDKNFNRVKVKTAEHLRLHRLKGNGITEKGLYEALVEGVADDIIGGFPEIQQFFKENIKDKLVVITDFLIAEAQKAFTVWSEEMRTSNLKGLEERSAITMARKGYAAWVCEDKLAEAHTVLRSWRFFVLQNFLADNYAVGSGNFMEFVVYEWLWKKVTRPYDVFCELRELSNIL
jgi:hypothetical protein